MKDKKGNKCFYVFSVEKIATPVGMQEGEWYRYIIGHDRSRIEGMKPGTMQEVKQHAETCVERLNSRSSKGYSTYSSSRSKKTK